MKSRDSGFGTRDSFWRTLDEKLGDPSFQRHLYDEFPSLLPTLERLLAGFGQSASWAGVAIRPQQIQAIDAEGFKSRDNPLALP